MTSPLDFPVFDADNHLYETEDAFTRHLPPAHKNLFRFVEINGRKKLVVRNAITEFIPNPTFEVVARPGAHMAFYAAENPEGKTLRELTGEPMRSIPAFRNPADRLALLDEQGVYACLMFPTLASLVEERLKDDPDLTHRRHPGLQRLAPRRVELRLPGPHLRHADREPVRARRGHRRARAGARPGRPGDPRAPRAGGRTAGATLAVPPRVRPVLGPGPGGRGAWWPCTPPTAATRTTSTPGRARAASSWPSDPRPSRYVADGGRTIQDTLASAICHGMLDRFPGVKLMSVENGGQWVHTLARNLELAFKKMPKEFPTHPLEVLRRNVWLNPFWEESVLGLVELMGADRVCFGSDYPHPEGMAEPLSFLDHGRRPRARGARARHVHQHVRPDGPEPARCRPRPSCT